MQYANKRQGRPRWLAFCYGLLLALALLMLAASPTYAATVKVGADGKAPSGLAVGTQVVTGGGTYTITGVNADGSYKSTLTNKNQTTSNYSGSSGGSSSGGSSSSDKSSSGGSSGSSGKTNSTVVVGASGKAPSGLPVGTQVVTGGGTYTITGVNADGTYTSVLTNRDQTTYNYSSSSGGSSGGSSSGGSKTYTDSSGQSQLSSALQSIAESSLSEEEKISQALSYLGYEDNAVNRAAMEATLDGYADGSYNGGNLMMEGGNIINYTVDSAGNINVQVIDSYEGAVDLTTPEAQAALQEIIAAKEGFAAAQANGQSESVLQGYNDAANAARETLGYSGGYNGNYYISSDTPAASTGSGSSGGGGGKGLKFFSTINAGAGLGGSISPFGSVSVIIGGSKSFSIKANAGYKVDAVYVDGVNLGAKSSYTFKKVKADHTIEAAFKVADATKIPSYTITATAGEGGYISPSGKITVKEGGSQSFIISAKYGYGIGKVMVDGVNAGSLSGYGFTNITRNHSIEVSFLKLALPPALTASGTMRPSDTIKSGLGVEASVDVTAENCEVASVAATYSDGTTIALEQVGGEWVLPVNSASLTGARKHYIPIDWPDNSDFSVTYLVTAKDTDGNVITAIAQDSVRVVGSMYDDDQTTHE